MLIADSVAHCVSIGYTNYAQLSTVEAWIVILSYTFQIYYDFSGYTDMALGIGKMFNIELPQNFNNPYKATSVEEFWQRWHMSLTRFLRDYVYIPLGGNRRIFVTKWIGGGYRYLFEHYDCVFYKWIVAWC